MAAPADPAPAAPSDKNSNPSAAKHSDKDQEPLFSDSEEDSGSDDDSLVREELIARILDYLRGIRYSRKDDELDERAEVLLERLEARKDPEVFERVLAGIQSDLKHAQTSAPLYNPAPVFGQWAAAPTLRF